MSRTKSNIPDTAPEEAIVQIVTSRRGKPTMSLSAVKSLFICSNDSVQEFAAKHSIPLNSLQKYVQEGKWLQLRDENQAASRQVLREIIANQNQAALESELILQGMRISQLQDTIGYLARYRAEHGDLFARDPDTKELLLDHYGMPILMSLPTSKDNLAERKAQLEIVQILKTLMNTDEAQDPKPLPPTGGDDGQAKQLKNSRAKELLAIMESDDGSSGSD